MSTNTDLEAVKRRIAKMLDMAADKRGNEHQIAVAAAMAKRLMAKYSLSHKDVLLAAMREDMERSKVPSSSRFVTKVPTWYLHLGGVIADVMDVVYVLEKGSRPSMDFAGYAPDVQVAVWLFTHIERQLNKMAIDYWQKQVKAGAFCKDYQYTSPAYRRQVKDSYKIGVVTALPEKVAAVYRSAKEVDEPEFTAVESASLQLIVLAKRELTMNHFGLVKLARRPKRDINVHSLQGLIDSSKVAIHRVLTGDNEDVKQLS